MLNSVPQVLGSIFVHQCPLPGSLLPAPMATSHLEATTGDGPGEMNLVTLLDPPSCTVVPPSSHLLGHTCFCRALCHLPLVVFPFMCHHKQRRVLFLLQSMDSNILNSLCLFPSLIPVTVIKSEGLEFKSKLLLGKTNQTCTADPKSEH